MLFKNFALILPAFFYILPIVACREMTREREIHLNYSYKLLSILLIASSLFAQTSIAVLELQGKGLSEMEASILSDRLRHELFQTGKYRVVERELMGEIMNEQGFQLSECTSTECMVQIGQVLGVDQMVGGSVSKFGTMYSVAVRLVSVETGEFLGTATYDHEGRMEDLLKYGMKAVSGKLSGFENSEPVGTSTIPEQVDVTQIPNENKEISQQMQSTIPSTSSQKTNQIIQQPVSKPKIPTIMLRSELGVYGLANQDRKDSFDGTAGPLFGVNGIFNIMKLPNFGTVGLLAGMQSILLVLSPQDSYLDWEMQELYVVTKAGLQAASLSQSKFNVTASLGYASVSTSTILVDERGDTSDPIHDSAGGLFADLIFSYRPLDKINFTLDGGFGTLVAGKDNFYGGGKFIVGMSLNF
ncbi:MAG: DUF2380 domain-containing protein [Bacteroidales bacterium]|nr:DUF2380 domain-containing protein [Bacteroidales bacterium]